MIPSTSSHHCYCCTRFSYVLLVFLSCYTLESTSFNLSPIESVLLKTRLDQISFSIKERFRDVILSSTMTTATTINTSHANYDTFIFPGSGGVDELILELNEKLSSTSRSVIIDWKEYRGSIATAAYDGEAVGVAIADLLSEVTTTRTTMKGDNYNDNNNDDTSSSSQPTQWHFIGISVGGFCANAAAASTYMTLSRMQEEEKEYRPPSSTSYLYSSVDNIKLTLLDPFCGRGIFGPKYGNEHFGKYATKSIQILNTDDPVPTTNDPLPNCVCFDVTKDPRRDAFVPPSGDSMHSWPLAYYARHFIEPVPLPPRGSVIFKQ
jgi:hypothetical protein